MTAIIEQDDPWQQFPALLGLAAVHRDRMNPFTVQFIQRSLAQVQPRDPIIPAAAHYLIGDFLNINLQRFDASLLYYQSAFSLLPDTTHRYARELRMRIQDRIAHLSLKNDRLEDAISAARVCEKIAQQQEHWFTLGHCRKCLGDIHRDYFSSADSSRIYYQDALEQFQNSFRINFRDKDTLATLLNLFYLTSIKLEMDTGFQDGKTYLDNASTLITTDKKYNDFRAQITYLRARFLAKDGNLNAALDTFAKAYQQFTLTNDTARMVQTKHLSAEILFQQNKPAETVEQLNQALELAPRVASASQMRSIQYLLYQAHKLNGNTDAALLAHEAFFQASQTVNQEDQQRFMLGLEAQYKMQAQQQQIRQSQEALAKKSTNNSILRVVVILLAITFSLLLISFIRAQKNRNELRHRNGIIIRQKQQLEELDDLKSQFFANISHELKTPLALIKAPLEYLRKKFPVSEGGEFFLDTAVNNTLRLERLVNELLDLSKIESGKSELQLKPLELKLLSQQILESFRPYALTKNVTINWAGAAKAPLFVHTEREAFQKILTNLLSNAIQFSPSDSQVVVDFELKGKQVILSVKDEGPGIYPDDLAHIFDRFHQSAHLDVHRDNSTGIGLALSSELAQLMNGQLLVESERGRGSTFFLHLPVAKSKIENSGNQHIHPIPETEAGQDVFQEMESLKKKDFHILIVEDHEELRTYLSKLLGAYFQVHTAANGKEAMALITAIDSPLTLPGRSMIISDLMMPEMDGVELVEQLKQDNRLQNIPVIILTAHRDRSRRIKTLTIGVDDYLVKPFDNQELLIRIKNLVRRSQQKINTDSSLGEARHDKNKPTGIGQDHISLDSEQQTWLKELEAVALKHLGDSQFNVGFLSNYANMSDRNFQRHIKRITGMTPSEYIKEIRLHHARELLESGRINSVKAVSRAVGFNSQEYFSNQFYNRFGRRPSTYLG